MSTATVEQTPVSEAAFMLEFFTEAPIGHAVMDGAGHVWVRGESGWSSATRRQVGVVSSLVLARALCPDLAGHMPEES